MLAEKVQFLEGDQVITDIIEIPKVGLNFQKIGTVVLWKGKLSAKTHTMVYHLGMGKVREEKVVGGLISTLDHNWSKY